LNVAVLWHTVVILQQVRVFQMGGAVTVDWYVSVKRPVHLCDPWSRTDGKNSLYL